MAGNFGSGEIGKEAQRSVLARGFGATLPTYHRMACSRAGTGAVIWLCTVVSGTTDMQLTASQRRGDCVAQMLQGR
jgi:hypothetical protein